MFDSARLRDELAEIHQVLARLATTARGKGLVQVWQRAIGGTSRALLWQALYADCVRIAYAAVTADGEIAGHEIAALHGLLADAARSYAKLIAADYGEFHAIDHAGARAFLDRYGADLGPFGRGSAVPWPGLALCRRAAELGEGAALARYQAMLTRLLAEVREVGGVTEGDPRWRGRVDDLDDLGRALARDAAVDPSSVDRRVQAFLTPSGVFNAVQPASSIFENDPFDVESIHAEARRSFEQVVARARRALHGTQGGQMLLVLGDSGCGKTHLLRGFRRHVQEYRRGFVVYAQLQSGWDDYERYLLQHLVDSLERPYSEASGQRSGLRELAGSLVELASEPLRDRAKRLTDDSWDGTGNLASYVNDLVDDLLRERDLARFDRDLLRALLYALRPDPRTTSSVYKYLRCEDMNAHDRRWIGDVVPRTGRDDPHRMILQIGRLAALAQRAVVVMIDQVDLAGFEASASQIFRRAIDALYRITSELPSAVAVIACLSDVYEAVRAELNRPALDRLERNPAMVRLKVNCSYPEIEAAVACRLTYLFTQHGTVHRPEQPVYPIPEAMLKGLTGWRLRDVLEWCHEFQARCIDAGVMLGEDERVIVEPKKAQPELDQIAAAWNDALHAEGIDTPNDDGEILAAVTAAAQACADELGIALAARVRDDDLLRVTLSEGAEAAELAISVTNKNYHRGAFGAQIERLRKRAEAAKAVAVAVRTLEFPRGESSERVIAQLVAAGGRRVHLDALALRTLAAFQRFAPDFPAEQIRAWCRRDRPISSLTAVAAMFDLERLRRPSEAASVASDPPPADGPPPSAAAPPELVAAIAPSVPRSGVVAGGAPSKKRRQTPRGVPVARAASEPGPAPQTSAEPLPVPVAMPLPVPAPLAASAPAPAPRATEPVAALRAPTAPVAASSSQLQLGVSPGFDPEPRALELGSLLRHMAILGGPGTGKTTLALHLAEQALSRGIPVVLLDRKGDLAGYARPGWWQRAADPERARRLAERLDVRLFTPGSQGGRPLALPVVDVARAPDHERDRIVQAAAGALDALLPAGDAARPAILGHAIAVLAGRGGPRGLAELIALVASQDDALVARAARAGRYDDGVFKRLVHDLEALQQADPGLFDPSAEPLTAETLIGPGPDGRVPLAIVSTRFLGDVPRTQSWVAQLIQCLGRHAARTASSELRTLFVIDEAEVFLPAGTARGPAKEALQELLRRAGAAGLGVVLASQSPEEFDTRSRELIKTWLIGRIPSQAADRMKALFERLPPIRGKLAMLELGRFVLLQDRGVLDVERTPPLMRAEPRADAELLALAAGANLPGQTGPQCEPARQRITS